MDYNRDNPLKRFTAFWVAFLIVATFGIGLIILGPFIRNHEDKANLAEDARRLEIKEEVDKLQESTLDTGKLGESLKALAEGGLKNGASPGKMALPPTTPPAGQTDSGDADAPDTADPADSE